MATDATVPISLDDYFQSTPVGSIERAIGNNLYGINHRQTPGMVPMNKDVYGLTFFVRPQLNLQSDNIRNQRRFYPLLTELPMSVQRYVRCTLDPRLMLGYGGKQRLVPPISCPFVDNENAFIPILTNNLNTISGWSDITLPTFDSKPGLFNEVYSQVDGTAINYEAFNLTATFRNTKGDPILYTFYIWELYAALVFEGNLVPYPDFIVENTIDYNTRIYRLVLDSTKQFVTKIAATGIATPISVAMGSFFDYNNEVVYNDQNKDITITFKCLGSIYQDDILIDHFNKTVQIFNPAMKDVNRETAMVKLSRELAELFNNRGYPRINPKTYELEWWTLRDTFDKRSAAFLNSNMTDLTQQDINEVGD